MKSGSLDVFATPALVALMEQAACNLVEPLLDEDTTSVGISLNISHDAATAVGRQAKAVLVGINGRKLSFKLTASDEHGIIGQGSHERFLVKKEKFMNNLKTRYDR